MADEKKVVLTHTEVTMCKMLAVAGLDEEHAKAEAEGTPFDYEAEKAKREQEFTLLYAEQKRKKQEEEKAKDRAFQNVISEVCGHTKLYSYIRDHVPDLKALRNMDPADALKAQGYGKKTADELKKLQGRIHEYPKVLTRLNKAIEAQRRLLLLLEEHGEVVGRFNRLKADARHTRNDFSHTWRYYGG
jgi:predicted  nucleic acid-binding Zn-ribbon protein